MSQLLKSLEHRIQELKTTIDGQTAELAAYEKVLAVEQAKGGVLPETKQASAVAESEPTAFVVPELTGSKTDFISAILRARGTSGATPKEIDEIFSSRKIARSKNLIYNALSFLVKQKKLTRKDGKYFALSAGAAPASSARKKRKISPEGLRNIIEATKRRWAAKRATQEAQMAAASKKTHRRKKAAR